MKTPKKFCYYAFALLGSTLMLFNSCKKNDDDTNIVKDIDGNVYKTVKIGDQEWFAVNLRTTKYNNGTAIPNITDDTEWSELFTGAYSWYKNNEATYKNAYGALYNWYAVNTGNLCPTGWRVPTDAEWTTLTKYIGGESVAGGKLKSTSTTPNAHPRWESPNTGATDAYGFSAFPGGSRNEILGSFFDVGFYGGWWSSTVVPQGGNWSWFMGYNYGGVGHYPNSMRLGLSIRCLRDN